MSLQAFGWLLIAIGVAWLIVAWLVTIRRLRREVHALRSPTFTYNADWDDARISVWERSVLYDWQTDSSLGRAQGKEEG